MMKKLWEQHNWLPSKNPADCRVTVYFDHAYIALRMASHSAAEIFKSV